MARRAKKTTRVSVSLEEDDYRRLLAIAEGSDASVAWVIRRAIAELFERDRVAQEGHLPAATTIRDA